MIDPTLIPLTAAEFKTVRESLGLSADWIAERVGVQVRTVRRWEDGTSPIPEDAWVALVRLEQLVDAAVDNLLDEFGVDDPDDLDEPVVVRVPRVDVDSPDGLPASVHRAVAARLRWELPGRVILEFGPTTPETPASPPPP